MEVNTEVTPEPAKVEASAAPVVTIEELQAELAREKASKQRVLDESNSYKTKLQAHRTATEAATKTALEESGNFKEIASTYAGEISDLRLELKDERRMALTRSINFEVLKHAGDVYDIQDIINNINITSDMVNAETKEVHGIAGEMDRLRKIKPNLFKANVPGMNTRPPGYEKTPEVDEFDKLSGNEKLNAIAGSMFG